MFAIQLFDTIHSWITGAFLLLALIGAVTAFAKRQFGAMFITLLVAAALGVFVFMPNLFRAASEKVCEETSADLTVNGFECATNSGGGGIGGTPNPVQIDERPVVIVDGGS